MTIPWLNHRSTLMYGFCSCFASMINRYRVRIKLIIRVHSIYRVEQAGYCVALSWNKQNLIILLESLPSSWSWFSFVVFVLPFPFLAFSQYVLSQQLPFPSIFYTSSSSFLSHFFHAVLPSQFRSSSPTFPSTFWASALFACFSPPCLALPDRPISIQSTSHQFLPKTFLHLKSLLLGPPFFIA